MMVEYATSITPAAPSCTATGGRTGVARRRPGICKEHNRVIVEYALKDTTRPIGVARWELTSSLPEDLRGALPSPEQLATGLGTDGGAGAS
jgi:hypothetical protein